jgi:hypothetical protein
LTLASTELIYPPVPVNHLVIVLTCFVVGSCIFILFFIYLHILMSNVISKSDDVCILVCPSPPLFFCEVCFARSLVFYVDNNISCFNLIFSRTKVGTSQTESVLISQLQTGLAMEFERSDHARRIRLLLSELLFVASQVNSFVLVQRSNHMTHVSVFLHFFY